MYNIYIFVSAAASSTTGPDAGGDRDASRAPGRAPSSWSIEEVMQFVRDADPKALAPHAELFRKHVSDLFLSVNQLWEGGHVSSVFRLTRQTRTLSG